MAGRIIAGGDIRQLTIGGRQLRVPPETDIKLSIGGKVNDIKLCGDGTPYVKQTNRTAGISDCTVLNDNDNQTLEYLQGLSDDATETAVVLALVDGTVYGGQLIVDGELDLSTGEGTIGLSMHGSKFEQI